MLVPMQADFSNDPWWIVLVKAVLIILFLILSVIMALWVERRGLGLIQTRPGPNVHGPAGLFQALADALKLIAKEDMWLRGADKLVYLLAPIVAAWAAFSVLAAIPLAGEVNLFGHQTPLQVFDSPVAMLVILAISAVGIYGIVLGGWSANSPYPLLGSLRSTAQVISYELAMGAALVSVFLMAGTMSTSGVVDAQTSPLWLVGLLPAFIVYVISSFGETNRLPFDLTECESELVAGHMTEYSAMKFAWFYLAEYINIFNVSSVAVTMFLGGYKAPWPGEFMNYGWWGLLWFSIKLWLMFFFFVWVRGTLVRFRYDQFMNLGWKILIPVAFVWLAAVAVIKALPMFWGLTDNQVFLVIGGVCAVLLIIVLLIPDRTPKKEPLPEILEDAFAGGYPVPPLPGQKLAPSPRAGRIKVVPPAAAEPSITAEEER